MKTTKVKKEEPLVIVKQSRDGHKVPQPPSAQQEWKRFKSDLALCLADLSEDEFLILASKRKNYYIQFAAQGNFGMRAEATSNVYVEQSSELLSAEAYGTMRHLGWNVPSATHGTSPDPDGSPNFFFDYPSPVNFKFLADLAAETLRRVYGVYHPGLLKYKSFWF